MKQLERLGWLVLGTGFVVCLFLLNRRLQPSPNPMDTPDHPVVLKRKAAPSTPIRRFVAFEDIKFESPIVRERVSRIESTARKIAEANWQHHPWHLIGPTGQKQKKQANFVTEWCSHADGKSHCSCTVATPPCHSITLVAARHRTKSHERDRVYSLSLIAHNYPAKSGLGAWLVYTENWHHGKQIQEQLIVQFFRTPRVPGSNLEAEFVLPVGSYQLAKRIGSVEYVFAQDLRHPLGKLDPAQGYVQSAESLRTTAASALDTLQALIAKRIEKADVTRVMDHALLTSEPPTRNPPVWGRPMPTEFRPPIPEKYSPTAERKRLLQEQLVIELDDRREYIRKNADQLYSAMEKAFPLSNVLDEPDASASVPED